MKYQITRWDNGLSIAVLCPNHEQPRGFFRFRPHKTGWGFALREWWRSDVRPFLLDVWVTVRGRA